VKAEIVNTPRRRALNCSNFELSCSGGIAEPAESEGEFNMKKMISVLINSAPCRAARAGARAGKSSMPIFDEVSHKHRHPDEKIVNNL